MQGIRRESDGSLCAGPGQNNVSYATIRVHGDFYTPTQFRNTLIRLQSDLDFSLMDSYTHIKHGLKMFKYRWNHIKWYNNINAKSEAYPAKVMAWLKFLDGVFEH